MKTLNVENTRDAQDKVSDIKVKGKPDVWQLICKASSEKEGWMKSTKAMDLPNGVLIQVSTQQGNNIAEALEFVPGISISDLSQN